MLNIVVDFRGVLCDHHLDEEKNARFYEKRGAIVTASVRREKEKVVKEGYSRYVFPGVIEFLKLIDRTPEATLSFYSSGFAENRILAEALVKLAEIKKTFAVLNLGDAFSKKCYKDLSLISKDLKNTVLIDDNISYRMPGQFENCLIAPCASDDDFYEPWSYFSFYKKRGVDTCTKNHEEIIFCCFSKEEWPLSHFDRYIYIFKKENGYKFHFVDEETCVFTERFFTEEDLSAHAELLALLRKLSQKDKRKEVYKPKDLEAIHHFVRSLNGKTSRVYRSINRICYITGLLFKSWEIAKEKNLPITKVLSQLQEEDLSERDDLYHFGQSKLREVNPNYHFMTPKIHSEDTEGELDSLEQERFSSLKREETDDFWF